MKTASDTHSRIMLEDGVIRFTSTEYADWTMGISDLRLFGEATNQNGPFSDDYFLCFATESPTWEEAPIDSRACDEFLIALGKHLNAELSLGLCNSTDFASRVIWPLKLQGEPMFAFTDVTPKTFIGRIVGSFQNIQTFSEQALSVLQQRHNK